MFNQTEFLITFPDSAGEKFKYCKVSLARPPKLTIHLASLSYEQTTVILKNIVLVGSPKSTAYKVSENEYLVHEQFAVPKLSYGHKPFRAETNPRKIAKRLLVLHQILRTSRGSDFDFLKFLTISHAERIYSSPLHIHKLSRKGFRALRKHEKKPIAYSDFYSPVPSLPTASEIKVPTELGLSKTIKNLDVLVGRWLSDPSKYSKSDNTTTKLECLIGSLKRYERHW